MDRCQCVGKRESMCLAQLDSEIQFDPFNNEKNSQCMGKIIFRDGFVFSDEYKSDTYKC